jgi:hypothetical protein
MSDDVACPKPEIDRQCLEKKCQTQVRDYRKCLERIATLPSEKEPHCWGWYYEIVTCVDHCTDHELWHHLK